jgi:cell division protein FtsX
MPDGPDERPRPAGPDMRPRATSRLAGLVQRRPVATVVVAALAAALATAALTVAAMVESSTDARSPVAAPSSSVASWLAEAGKQVTVFLSADATEEQRRSIETALRRLPSVKDFRFESRQEAYARFEEQFKDVPDLLAHTNPETFPESYRVTLKDRSGFCDVASLGSQPGVSDVVSAAGIGASCR